MKELIIIILINIMAIVFLTYRERKKREKIREMAEKERARIRQEAEKEIKIIKRETEEFINLVDLFTNRVKLYNSNPKKFCAYEEEFLEWHKQIVSKQMEYAKECIMQEKNTSDSFHELLTMLEQFEKWTKGKIE